MFDIFRRQPINKTAALVSNQSGCSDRLTIQQERAILLSRLSRLREDNKNNGNEIAEVNSRLSQLNLFLSEQKRHENLTRSYAEWTEFRRLVEKEIGKERTFELKLQAEMFARLKHCDHA